MRFGKDISSNKKQRRKRGIIMGKLQYLVQEIFVSAGVAERESRLQSLMEAYLRTLEKQIAQNEGLE